MELYPTEFAFFMSKMSVFIISFEYQPNDINVSEISFKSIAF